MSVESLGADVSVVRLDNRLRHRKAYTGPACLRVAAGIRTIKAIEKAIQIALGIVSTVLVTCRVAPPRERPLSASSISLPSLA